ncbi:twin-arginine translocase subunit TatB [Spongiibacter sp. KMU-166]|uniref:Sec-independent protein translocase protein TatB n=1 Tax=Spongiibacter thalassae TaxID=2721624 RepID=A0ABX1GJS2_9GAMM|nr:Sec-independent protein translocase protein TatB [Spongiibacter thalassae]NKI19484.1 twin-arginine translocase subunit TatB [Spongiibacter thalassae]
MFDIGFAELLVIAVLGLLVLGPERLPSAIRTTSLWLGRLRRSFNNVRQEIEREVGADEIRRQLHNEAVLDSLNESKAKLQSTLNSAGDELKNIENSIAPASGTDPNTAVANDTLRTAPTDKKEAE